MRQPLDFHAHHAAFGAYGSFTLGALGKGGGFNVHDGRHPCREEVYIGYGRAGEGLKLLPFSTVSGTDLSAFATPSAKTSGCPIRALPEAGIDRHLGWGTDTWTSGTFRLTFHTPFGPVPDPRREGWAAVGDALLPAVWAELELDNSGSRDAAVVVFGIGQGDTGVGPLEREGLVGATRQGREGFATPADTGAKPFCAFSLSDAFGKDLAVRPPHWLGSTFGVAWTVPAGRTAKFPLVLGWHVGGPATSGIATTYAYTHLWPDLDAVLARSVACHEQAREIAARRDAELDAAPMSDQRKWMLAHATRGYFGSSQLLSTPDGEPVCVVNEGEYCMMNTLDLAVDHAPFEARFFPWFTREVLELAADRYSFVDGLKIPGETAEHPGGLSFCHDMGVRNRFSAEGNSSYEKSDLEGCFSHMTFEQACNWPLAAALYAAATDDRIWCGRHAKILEGVLDSLQRREHPDPARRTGIPGTDSTRCGTGTEITTYDSLDPSLAQTRQNLYTSTKLWAAYLAFELLLELAGRSDLARAAREASLRSAGAVAAWPERDGVLPAIADGRNASAILPAVEGLVYPLAWGDAAILSPDGPFGPMVRRLGRHLAAVLERGLCRFPDGGWKLSSTSDNSWLSKIWIAQAVSERVFGRAPDTASDAAHVTWLAPGSSEWGFCDQIEHAKAIGSRYYPRGVTSILFLD